LIYGAGDQQTVAFTERDMEHFVRRIEDVARQ
jgi:hypothetical protein